jgi:hypothetical protein
MYAAPLEGAAVLMLLQLPWLLLLLFWALLWLSLLL